MKVIVEGIIGSHLHGTANENSDTDLVSIFVPSKRELIMNDYEDNFNKNTNGNTKNSSSDRDHKFVSLKKFVRDAMKGDLYAMDALRMKEFGEPIWQKLVDNRMEIFRPNPKAVLGVLNQSQRAISTNDKNVNKISAHSLRIYHSYQLLKKGIDFDYPIETNGYILDVKEGRIPVDEYKSRIDLAILGMSSFNIVPIKKQKIIDKWEHWVYCRYLEITRGER